MLMRPGVLDPAGLLVDGGRVDEVVVGSGVVENHPSIEHVLRRQPRRGPKGVVVRHLPEHAERAGKRQQQQPDRDQLAPTPAPVDVVDDEGQHDRVTNTRVREPAIIAKPQIAAIASSTRPIRRDSGDCATPPRRPERPSRSPPGRRGRSCPTARSARWPSRARRAGPPGPDDDRRLSRDADGHAVATAATGLRGAPPPRTRSSQAASQRPTPAGIRRASPPRRRPQPRRAGEGDAE